MLVFWIRLPRERGSGFVGVSVPIAPVRVFLVPIAPRCEWFCWCFCSNCSCFCSDCPCWYFFVSNCPLLLFFSATIWNALITPLSGMLAARTTPPTGIATPCHLPPIAGYDEPVIIFTGFKFMMRETQLQVQPQHSSGPETWHSCKQNNFDRCSKQPNAVSRVSLAEIVPFGLWERRGGVENHF